MTVFLVIYHSAISRTKICKITFVTIPFPQCINSFVFELYFHIFLKTLNYCMLFAIINNRIPKCASYWQNILKILYMTAITIQSKGLFLNEVRYSQCHLITNSKYWIRCNNVCVCVYWGTEVSGTVNLLFNKVNVFISKLKTFNVECSAWCGKML